jgi:DNA-binding transcriptional regulator YbjK
LFQGTRKDNMIDAKSKNRVATGFNLPQTKLSQSDINSIINDGIDGLKHKDIAQKYNVTRSLITYYINKNKQLIQEK